MPLGKSEVWQDVDTAAHLSSEHDILDDVDEESGLYNSIEI
jgi:hypothetical protein